MKEYIFADPEFLDNFNSEVENLLSDYKDDDFSAKPGQKGQTGQYLPTEVEVTSFNEGLSKYRVNALQLFMKIVQLTKLLHDQTYKLRQRQKRLRVKERRQRMHTLLSNIKKSMKIQLKS